MSKFVAEDVPLFLSLIDDLFPGLKVERSQFPDVMKALEKVGGRGGWVRGRTAGQGAGGQRFIDCSPCIAFLGHGALAQPRAGSCCPGKRVPIELGTAAVSLTCAASQVVEEKGLQKHPSWMNKCIQLYETYLVRHGIMVVGPGGRAGRPL